MDKVIQSTKPLPSSAEVNKTRLVAIDALRGLVMVIMLLDHVRETWFLHHAISDPMNALTIDPALFFTRITSQLCAPIFVFLTGLGAWLYGQSHTKRETSTFLLSRGAFLMVIELTVMTLAWATAFPPTFWLQVIWCIGVCMIILAGLLHLPRKAQIIIGLAIVCGHNLLDGIVLHPGDTFYVPWAMLHQRALIELGGGFTAKTTYPIFAWIGVILLGYALGPWFANGSAPKRRQKHLVMLGAGMLVGFVILRAMNVYGDKPWFETGDILRTVMSFLALTKYPPSLLFLTFSLGIGALLLALLERYDDKGMVARLAVLGGAPMFFYIFHLYVLRILYNGALLIYGPNHGNMFGVDGLGWIWIWWVALIVPLYFPTKWFAALKRKRRDIWWLKYL